MTPVLLAALSVNAYADSAIEFKTTGPVAIFVDGQQATLTSNLRQRVNGLTAGVHQLEVSGMFGKKLYEAEIDLPDNTITYASWERGEIKVLKTDWLKDEEDVATDDVEQDDGAQDVAEAEVPIETALPVAAPPVAPAGPVTPAVAPSLPSDLVSPDGTVAGSLPPIPVGGGAIAAVPADLAVAASPAAVPAVDPGMAGPAELPGGVVAPVAADEAVPVVAAVPANGVEAIAVPPPAKKTLTLQGYDGMRLVLKTQDGHQVQIMVEGQTIHIQDENGLNLALGGDE